MTHSLFHGWKKAAPFAAPCYQCSNTENLRRRARYFVVHYRSDVFFLKSASFSSISGMSASTSSR
jgi:hypothetical protein